MEFKSTECRNNSDNEIVSDIKNIKNMNYDELVIEEKEVEENIKQLKNQLKFIKSEKKIKSKINGENSSRKKHKRKLSFSVILFIIAFLSLTASASYYAYNEYGTKAIMEDFMGKPIDDVKDWVAENEIKVKYVEKFSEEYDENVIFEQNLKKEDKVKKKTEVIFVVSKGKNPDLLIDIPDFKGWKVDEIQKWLEDNLISKSDFEIIVDGELEPGIFVEFKLEDGITKENYKRSDNITFIISKPENSNDPIKIPDFTNWAKDKIENWSLLSGITTEYEYSFSDEIEKGNITEQSVEVGKKLMPGNSITVTVSKGAAVLVPNLVNKTVSEAKSWASKNNITIRYIEKYASSTKDYIIKQSISSNSEVESGSEITITKSLGNTISIPRFSTPSKLESWINSKNNMGANLSKGKSYEFSSISKGLLISPPSGSIKIGSKIYYKISKGPAVTLINFAGMSESEIKSWASTNKIKVTFKDQSSYNNSVPDGIAVSQSLTGKVEQNTTVTITLSKGKEPSGVLMGFINNLGYIKDGNPSGTVQNIKNFMNGQGFTNYSVITTNDSNVSKGYVIDQSHNPGKYKVTTKITIYVSLGPK